MTDHLNTAYDYIVVGAGSAGSVLARRLLDTTDGTVMLVESGGPVAGVGSIAEPTRWVENIGGPYDHGYTYDPNPHLDGRSMPLVRGKALGGSGAINAMVWVRGQRADFDGWAAAGNTGWDYDSVLPRFKRSEDWEDGGDGNRGAGGPMPIARARDLHPVAQALIDAGRELGIPYLDDPNVPDPEGVGPINTNVRDGERVTPYQAFVEPVGNDNRLTVLSGARVTRLRLHGMRCTGVVVHTADQLHTVEAAEEVVLCAGAIDSPRLLMLSGIGPGADLRRLGIRTVVDLPGVGRNLQEHPIVAGLCFEAMEEALAPLNNNLEGTMALCRSGAHADVPDLAFVPVQIPYVSNEVAAAGPIPPNAFCIAPGLMRVRSRGHVRLRSASPDGALEIQSNMLADPADLDALVAGIQIGLDLASQASFRRLIRRWVAPAGPLTPTEAAAFARRSTLPYFHAAGTCAMGLGEDAVVGPDLRVHGVERLRVADASVMPEITSANTQAPTLMIAETAADLLWQSVTLTALEGRHQ
jgi:choline dehydrogenase-like flavoprotein